MTVWAVVPAAGRGVRMASEVPKPYLSLHGRTVLEWSIDVLTRHPAIARTVIALSEEDRYWERLDVARSPSIIRVAGGEERCLSVYNALARLRQIGDDEDWVVVHDAARPCLRIEDLDLLIRRVEDDGTGGLLACPVSDTVKRSDDSGYVVETISRVRLWRALTPQMFQLGMLFAAIRSATDAGVMVTDEAAAMERTGYRPILVGGHGDNIKITTPDDLTLAEHLLSDRRSPR